MITELNPIYEKAWQEQEGSGSFYYTDPDHMQRTGKKLNYPCLFRLLRTNDTLKRTNVNDRYARSESFLACIKVSDFPGPDEETMENRLLKLVQGFLRTLRKDGRIQFNVPTNYMWYRRDIEELALCLKFNMEVSVIAEDWQCL